MGESILPTPQTEVRTRQCTERRRPKVNIRPTTTFPCSMLPWNPTFGSRLQGDKTPLQPHCPSFLLPPPLLSHSFCPEDSNSRSPLGPLPHCLGSFLKCHLSEPFLNCVLLSNYSPTSHAPWLLSFALFSFLILITQHTTYFTYVCNLLSGYPQPHLKVSSMRAGGFVLFTQSVLKNYLLQERK